MVTDPVANMLVGLKNAARAGRGVATVPYSEFKFAIAESLRQQGFLKTVTKRGKKVKKTLDLELAYDGKQAKLNDVARISKPSRRVYHSVHDIRSVRQGHGAAIYSTPRGILTDREARKQKVGGEVLFKIW